MFVGIEMNSPLKKITKGEDVAELVMFLASDRASCISGSCYVIDCGLMLGDSGNFYKYVIRNKSNLVRRGGAVGARRGVAGSAAGRVIRD
ncbi:hypothetical protein PYW07_005195 [Mythimna separata]|uniref:SDR family oxidoreductase n=1 Tax=Mythimna separata TaxID=271217 RepID=A0AAD7YFC4_MYTSE|nr:hypothetical protein PYW07_005195 [Mythimna separata]